MLLKNPRKNDLWDELTQIERDAVEEGLNDVRAFRVKSHKEGKKLYEKWLQTTVV